MGLFGAIAGGVAGFFVGGPVGSATGAAVGSQIGNSSGSGGAPSSNEGLIAMANASRDAMITQSNNMLMGMQTQAAVMELGIMENSRNAQFQTLAWLTERLDANDTKLEIARANAELRIQEESNRNTEALEGLELDARELEIRKIG